MDVKIGSNVFRNTNGILIIHGKEQIVFEARPEAHQLLLTMDLYSADSEHLAHLRRNVWGFNIDELFDLAAGPDSVDLSNKAPWLRVTASATGKTALEGSLEGTDVVVVSSGLFHTHKGQLVEISSHYCRIAGSPAMFGDVMDLRGRPVTIG